MRLIGAAALVLLLAGCGGSTTVVAGGDGGDGGDGGNGAGVSKPSVTDRPTGEWRTTSIKQAPSSSAPGVKPDAFTLRFLDGGRVIAQARCNSISGSYRITDGTFRMDSAAQTEMGCPGDNRHEEDTWLSAFLTSGPAWSFDGKRIGLDGPEIDVELAPREEVQPNKPIVGTTWTVTHLTDGPAPGAPADPNSSVSAGSPMGAWVLTFTRTEVNGRGTCATFAGPAEQRAGVIRFGPITKDLSKCPDGDPGLEEVLAVLAGDVTVEQHIETLTLTHSSGKGLQLSAEGTDSVDEPESPTPDVGSGTAKPNSAGQAFSGEWRAGSITEKPSSSAPGVKPETFVLRFHNTNGVGVQARCNSIGGEYRVEGDRLVVEQIGQTLIGCPGDREQEDRWLSDFLGAAPRFRFDGGSLHLSTDHITVVFERAP